MDDNHPHQSDIFSDYHDLDLVQHLVADLHDDMWGKITRFRHLTDLSGALGSSGTMLFGGETTYSAWREARWSYIHGNFAATVLLCQGLAEHLLAGYLSAALFEEELPQKIAFAETLRRCLQKEVISEVDATDLRRLMALRNPLSHFRDINDEANLSRRAMVSHETASSHLERDAGFAVGLAIRILALPTFRLGLPIKRAETLDG